jgi:hypothetical protein
MTDRGRAKRSLCSGRHWLVAAVAMPLSPLLFGVSVQQNQTWHACVARHGSPVTPMHGPCAGTYSWMALATLGFWLLALAATLTGTVIGVVEGRHRRRFAHSRWFSMTVVGLCAPWALLAYAVGYGLGRLLPARRPNQVQEARRGGWQQAVHLYAALASGQHPPVVYAPDLPNAGIVYMDVPFRYSRFFAVDVAYQPGAMLAVGPPGFVAGAAIGRLIGTSIGYARAASLSRRQWRGHHIARVVVSATTTWCQVGGRWLRFDHTTRSSTTGWAQTSGPSSRSPTSRRCGCTARRPGAMRCYSRTCVTVRLGRQLRSFVHFSGPGTTIEAVYTDGNRRR